MQDKYFIPCTISLAPKRLFFLVKQKATKVGGINKKHKLPSFGECLSPNYLEVQKEEKKHEESWLILLKKVLKINLCRGQTEYMFGFEKV